MEYDKLEYKEINFIYHNERDLTRWHTEISMVDRIHSGENHCEMNLKFYDRTFKTLSIDYEMFDRIFSKLIALNFNELIIKSSLLVLGGDDLEISICYGSSSINLHIRCYDHNYKKRGLEEIYIIYKELLEIFNEYATKEGK
jgi:hypothetical protein